MIQCKCEPLIGISDTDRASQIVQSGENLNYILNIWHSILMNCLWKQVTFGRQYLMKMRHSKSYERFGSYHQLEIWTKTELIWSVCLRIFNNDRRKIHLTISLWINYSVTVNNYAACISKSSNQSKIHPFWRWTDEIIHVRNYHQI